MVTNELSLNEYMWFYVILYFNSFFVSYYIAQHEAIVFGLKPFLKVKQLKIVSKSPAASK